jgi:ABC-type antimicrobial peptide transport system permease subunit
MVVLNQGIILAMLGSALGLISAWTGIRALSALFFSVASVQSSDPLLLAGAPALLVAVALAACYLPARKSLRIDPAVALREE